MEMNKNTNLKVKAATQTIDSLRSSSMMEWVQ